LIENGDISWDGCIKDYYTFEYNLELVNDMVGTKFNYNNSDGLISQAVLYLSTTTCKENDQEAEINNIRREINNLRKEMNLKFTNKVNIYFEKDIFWDEMNPELIKLLSTRLGVDIKFMDKLEEYKVIKTYIGTLLKVFITVI